MNPAIPFRPDEDSEQPDETAALDRIERATRSVVMASYRSRPLPSARRDVHLKLHGCVYATLAVADEATFADLQNRYAVDFRQGVFEPGCSYRAWVRFSNSHKRPQPDPIGDGRGIAIKLLGVPDQPRLLDGEHTQKATQDFLLLNYPAFFARNIIDMAEVAELEAEDRFPANFFINRQHLNLDRLRGLQAFIEMAAQRPTNPALIEYFSQVPFKFGDHVVKYRVWPLAPAPNQYDSSDVFFGRDNYLFEALKASLDPSDRARVDIQLAFGVQLRVDPQLQPIDDATVVWDQIQSPFIRLATLTIPKQRFDGAERIAFGERIAFNPWNGLQVHKPLGSLNRARRRAYGASLELRYGLSRAQSPKYTEAEWEALRTLTSDLQGEPPSLSRVAPELGLVQLAGSIIPGPLSRVARRLSSSKLAFAIAPAALALICTLRFCRPPERYYDPFILGISSPALGLALPSEGLIPPAEFAARYRGTPFERDESVRKDDVRWLFRYAPTGSELTGGLPYWLFRALPVACPDEFEHRDWTQFGLVDRDTRDYYTSYHRLPRGMVLSDTVVHIAGNDFGVRLKRVSFNCASCHRGEYLDEQGGSQFVDGMPNLTIDTAGYKRASVTCLADPSLDTSKVLDAIDEVLAKERAVSGVAGPSALTQFEVTVQAPEKFDHFDQLKIRDRRGKEGVIYVRRWTPTAESPN